MTYEVYSLLCSNREHGELDYIGDGNYVCPICGLAYHDDEYDNDDSEEYISVYDAALIWASRGKDEDYMFNYSEYELENAL